MTVIDADIGARTISKQLSAIRDDQQLYVWSRDPLET